MDGGKSAGLSMALCPSERFYSRFEARPKPAAIAHSPNEIISFKHPRTKKWAQDQDQFHLSPDPENRVSG
jgi:hypothetical protein